MGGRTTRSRADVKIWWGRVVFYGSLIPLTGLVIWRSRSFSSSPAGDGLLQSHSLQPVTAMPPQPVTAIPLLQASLSTRGPVPTAFQDCESVPMVMWSRGFARECCDVFPWCFKQDAGDDRYKNDVARLSQLLNGSSEHGNDVIIYVPLKNLPDFVLAFVMLPASARIILVTGQEDYGVPRELWGEGRKEMRRDFTMHYKGLLEDSRLIHWFTQNYDLTGCSTHSGCSAMDPRSPLANKMTPVPIGLDFHTRDEKRLLERSDQQLRRLYNVSAHLLPWGQRLPRSLLVAFRRARHAPEREVALKALVGNLPEDGYHFAGKLSRDDFWRRIGKHKFVAAPVGRGLDTHRLWEVLVLGSVPVVRTSSLDRLYSTFPVSPSKLL
eukprot:TRINITY_DN13057_c0_g4_i2.p1 TRINITY_DN13057_c0_g4~~TRINITY_DN13057_c0_g4_i2.p1  ORF type:complete len:381 (-),score=30.52 TRINITY_DN13057_c0_g4_i2:453-1595(-)